MIRTFQKTSLEKLIRGDSRLSRIYIYGGLIGIIATWFAMFYSLGNGIQTNDLGTGMGGFFMAPIMIFPIFYWILQIPKKFIKDATKLWDRIFRLYKKQSETDIQSLNEVLELSKVVYQFNTELSRYSLLFKSIISSEGNLKIKLYFEEMRKLVLSLLIEIRNDIRNQALNKTKELKIAKNALNQIKISGSGAEELSQLQSARLDAQIKQFEELQKVLVKM